MTDITGITLRRTDNTVAIGLSTGKEKGQNFKWAKNISNNRQSNVKLMFTGAGGGGGDEKYG